MPAHALTDEQCREAVEAVRIHGSQIRAAAVLGISRSTLQNRLNSASARGLSGFSPVLPGFRIKETSVQMDADGKVEKTWVRQQQDRGDEFAVPAGHVVKGVSAYTDAEGRIIGQWVKTREGVDTTTLVDAIRETLTDYRAPPIIAPASADADLLTVYALPDLHLGLLAWGLESGENYDLTVASEELRQAVAELVAQSRPSGQAIVLGLGDTFHGNDQRNVTPRSGHTLDVDGRWPKVFRTGAQVAVDMTHLVAQRHGDVIVRFLPGNHDPDASVALTVALALFFHDTPRIQVDDDPGHHFYHRFGKVLIGATHGHTMKPDRMAMMLATDRPKDWGEASFRHFFYGHVHHEAAKEVGSVRVESFSSPAAKDSYAHAGGWRSGRALTAITFHRERGEIGRHRVNLPAFTLERRRIRVPAPSLRTDIP